MLVYSILIATIVFGTGLYFLLKYIAFKNKPYQEKFSKIYLYSITGVSLALLLVAYYVCPSYMISKQVTDQIFQNGCINLIGSPYGDNRIANFFAWFHIVLYYPTAIIAILIAFIDIPEKRKLLKYIIAPFTIINVCCYFNLNMAITTYRYLNFDTVMLAIEVGALTSSIIINFEQTIIKNKSIEIKSTWKDTVSLVIGYIAIVLCFLPTYSLIVLFSPTMELFGQNISLIHATNFSVLHRFTLYITIIFSVLIFAAFKRKSENTKRVVILLIGMSAVLAFLSNHSHHMTFNVKNLPLELSNIAIIVMLIAIIFKKQRLFNICFLASLPIITLFIFFPRYVSYLHTFNIDVRSYYHVQLSAFLMIAYSAGFKLFKFPTIKSWKSATASFVGYFLVINFLNAWLSNYVPGYNVNVVNSGVNFMSLNGDTLLKLFKLEKLLNYKIIVSVGKSTFRFYYLYHIIMILIFAFITVLGYLINILFRKVGTSHEDISNKLRIHKPKNKKNIKVSDSLVIKHLYKKYRGNNFYSLSDINLEIKPGEVVGLLGHNGAGKSTLIKSIVGQEEFQKGDVQIFGVSNSLETRKFKKYVGYIPDHYILYEDLTGREFVNYIADLYHVDNKTRKKNILYYLKAFNLTNAFDARIETYSFGMKQKIAIMSTLIHEPKVWLLDEPLTGLDPESIYQIKKCIADHSKKGNIVIFSSHLIDIVEELTTRVIILNKGSLVYNESTIKAKKQYSNSLEKLYLARVGTGGLI